MTTRSTLSRRLGFGETTQLEKLGSIKKDSLEDLLFSGMSDRPIWSRFLSQVAEQCEAGHAFFIVEGTPPERERPAIVSPFPTLDSQDVEASLFPSLRKLATLESRQLDTSYGKVIATRVELSEKRSAWLVLADFETPAKQCLDLLQGLTEALRRALPLYDLLGEAERRRLIAEYVIETSGTGVLLVEADGRVMIANDVANAITSAVGPLQIVGGRIQTTSPAMTRRLLDAVADMASKQSQQADLNSYIPIAVPDRERLQPLTLIVRPGPPYGPVSAPLKRTSVIILRDPARRAMLPEGDLEMLFALSPAEARLATRLANGDGLDDASTALGISRNTARSQLQSIFSKTGVNRQGDLVRLLLSSAATQAGGGTLPPTNNEQDDQANFR